MNDQLILEFVATKQPVRAVQLADKFDVDLKAASDALKSLVDVGDLVRTAGTAPNGQPAQVYGLSAEFVKSKEGKLLAARIEGAQATLAVAVAAPVAKAEQIEVQPSPAAAKPAPAALNKPTEPAESTASLAGINRAEAGVACIRLHGSVSDADLRVAMGLRAGQYPSAWLGAAIKRGDINKDGKNWTPGPGSEVKRQPAFGGSLGLPGATPHVSSAPPVPKFKDSAAPPAALMAGADDEPSVSAVAVPPKFRCGLWSDGVLELQRNGVTVAELERDEGETVAAFMARLRQPLEAA
ncbi:hypothetical protein [Duganella sp. BJB475]|uniref:hypothetical protein n=1 Tax=Duganella sp. BJB475 TaxID=2233914 RepID=UPI000E34CE09|nr:hypothetical protein [Duganella sp. BJB475]RFP19176.1 hypothetical protein D0T23_05180 [Duganella sp. BJB475]